MYLKKRQSSRMGWIALEVYVRRKQPQQVTWNSPMTLPRAVFQIWIAFGVALSFRRQPCFFKVPFGLIRQSHATVMAVSNNQQLGPFFVNIHLIRGRMVFYFFFFFLLSFFFFFFFLAIRASFLFSKAVWIVSGEALPVPSFLRRLRPPLPNRSRTCSPVWEDYMRVK